MLYLIGKTCDSKNIGLYRDDGVVAFKNESGPASEKVKKTFIIFLQTKRPANNYRLELESRKSS